MSDEQVKRDSKFEENLLLAMQAIDNQVARAMQRTPAERDIQGVSKWEPYSSRVESSTALILNELGEGTVTLDSVFILAQAFTKALRLASEDLGADGLGKVRTEYCVDTMEKIEKDASKTITELRRETLT